MNRERIGMTAGIILLLLFLASMAMAMNHDLARRWMWNQSFNSSMQNDVDDRSPIGGSR
jgi:hypothetical protein